jgi:hypothetical protein
MVIGVLVFGCQKNDFLWLLMSMVGIKYNNSKIKVLKVCVFLSHICVNFNHFHFFYIWQIVANIFDVLFFSCHVELQ